MRAFCVRTLFRSLPLATVSLGLIGQPAPAAAQTAPSLTTAVTKPLRAFEGIAFGSVDASTARQVPSVVADTPIRPARRAQRADEMIHCGIRVVSPPLSFSSNMPVHKVEAVLDPKFVVNGGCSIRD
jgi:hypothetical protein